MSNPQKLTCDEILQTLFQYLDHELPSDQQYLTYQFHFQDCVPCNEIMIHESQVLTILKDLLQGSCNERAPQDLHDRIREQTQTLAGQNQIGYFSSSTTITQEERNRAALHLDPPRSAKILASMNGARNCALVMLVLRKRGEDCLMAQSTKHRTF